MMIMKDNDNNNQYDSSTLWNLHEEEYDQRNRDELNVCNNENMAITSSFFSPSRQLNFTRIQCS